MFADILKNNFSKFMADKLAGATPKKPWQLRSDYLTKGGKVLNPKIAKNVNDMFAKWSAKKHP